MKILGVSGSPIKNSNTDLAVKTVLEATGVDSIGVHTLETQEDTEKTARDLGAGMRDFLADKARA